MCLEKLHVTVNQYSSLNYGGENSKIVFHRSVVKACFVFRNLNCPILKTALHRLYFADNVRSGRCPASISHVRLPGRTEIFR